MGTCLVVWEKRKKLDRSNEALVDFERDLTENNRFTEIVILRDLNVAFVQILMEPSEVLIGYYKYWELLRGVYNNKFCNYYIREILP